MTIEPQIERNNFAASDYNENFLLAERIKISSFSPKKKITMAAAIKYCNSEFPDCGAPSKVAITKPAKMPKPPRVGITALCSFLSSGSSNNFFSFATCMITGIEKKVIKKESPLLSIILSMNE